MFYTTRNKVENIISACYPEYKGNKVKISTNIPSNLDSYWDGGSRDYFVFYQLSTGNTIDVHSNHPFFEAGQPRELGKLPQGILLVEHTIFCGKDLGITIYANEVDLTPMLPEKIDISEDEKVLLSVTKGLKNSYAGQTDLRYKSVRSKYGWTKEKWEEVKSSCMQKEYLTKGGGITIKGKNAIANEKNEYWY